MFAAVIAALTGPASGVARTRSASSTRTRRVIHGALLGSARHHLTGDLRIDNFMVSLVYGWHPIIEGTKRLKGGN